MHWRFHKSHCEFIRFTSSITNNRLFSTFRMDSLRHLTARTNFRFFCLQASHFIRTMIQPKNLLDLLRETTYKLDRQLDHRPTRKVLITAKGFHAKFSSAVSHRTSMRVRTKLSSLVNGSIEFDIIRR